MTRCAAMMSLWSAARIRSGRRWSPARPLNCATRCRPAASRRRAPRATSNAWMSFCRPAKTTEPVGASSKRAPGRRQCVARSPSSVSRASCLPRSCTAGDVPSAIASQLSAARRALLHCPCRADLKFLGLWARSGSSRSPLRIEARPPSRRSVERRPRGQLCSPRTRSNRVAARECRSCGNFPYRSNKESSWVKRSERSLPVQSNLERLRLSGSCARDTMKG